MTFESREKITITQAPGWYEPGGVADYWEEGEPRRRPLSLFWFGIGMMVGYFFGRR
jgi:hypothetical protein